MANLKKRSARQSPTDSSHHRFGGRDTAGGVRYEERVAAFIAVKMLCGSVSTVWDNIGGEEIRTITMQAPEAVDDIVVGLYGDAEANIFISAKKRSTAIALTERNTAFVETVTAFISQSQQLTPGAREKCRLMWAVPSTAGSALTEALPTALETHRQDAGDDSVQDFLNRRSVNERKALRALITELQRQWSNMFESPAADSQVRDILRLVYVEVYDFADGRGLQRDAQNELRSHVVADPKKAGNAWRALEKFFSDVNVRGNRVNVRLIREALIRAGVELKEPPDYSHDIAYLRDLTARNLKNLQQHASLPFGPSPKDSLHLSRTGELSALLSAVRNNDLLVTGEPGCGKSGMLHSLAQGLEREGSTIALLLAEDLSLQQGAGSAPTLTGLSHGLDEILTNWTNGVQGYLITDALDAVRDADKLHKLRNMLASVKQGASGWRVIASVREYDLKYGQELRNSFAGEGVPDYSSQDFIGVAHFHLRGLDDGALNDLGNRRGEIRPFLEGARASVKSGEMYRSPFFLRLAAELLRDGAPPQRMADWTSPSLLLRKYWQSIIVDGEDADERISVLQRICSDMVQSKSMTCSAKALSLRATDPAMRQLVKRGILRSPNVKYGTIVGDDTIRFTHHILYDYAIARTLIPTESTSFCKYILLDSLLPIFYRQSFMFALEELWDNPAEGPTAFWQSAIQLEHEPQLYGVTRILAPVLAARRIESVADLEPLLAALRSSVSSRAALSALRHLASGLQDTDQRAIISGTTGWCTFTRELAQIITQHPEIEGSVALVLSRLNGVFETLSATERLSLNAAARNMLAHHLAKESARGNRFAARAATESLCRTFSSAPGETEKSLLAVLAPERLQHFPYNDLLDLANDIHHLPQDGDMIVLRLFEAAFASRPEPGEWESLGGSIMPLRFQTSDQWNMIHHALAEYYASRNGDNAALMTEAACIAWNATNTRRLGRHSTGSRVLASITFHGVSCDIIEDYSHISGRQFEHDENRIVSHFEKLLREWSSAGDMERLRFSLDRFAIRNQTAHMWTVLMEAGAEHPATLGAMLAELLDEPTFLIHWDYSYAGIALLGALHAAGDRLQRSHLEGIVAGLPATICSIHDGTYRWTEERIEHAQNRLLGVLEEPNIVLDNVRALWIQRQPFPENIKPAGVVITSFDEAEEEIEIGEDFRVTRPRNSKNELTRLRSALEPFLNQNGDSFDIKEVERRWNVLHRCEKVLARRFKHDRDAARDLWGHLVGACEKVVLHAEWPRSSKRWLTVRRILLQAVMDPIPRVRNDDHDDKIRGWGWLAPRIDAASGLPALAYRLGAVDKEVKSALRRLSRDKSRTLRYNLALRLPLLYGPSADLMWSLIDGFIANERSFAVLEAVLNSLNRLWVAGSHIVMSRIRLIADRIVAEATGNHHIHQTLARIHLFHFLRTGDPESEAHLNELIAECDSVSGYDALHSLPGACRNGIRPISRVGGPPDATSDDRRGRAWMFMSRLLAAAQTKLRLHRESPLANAVSIRPDVTAAHPVLNNLDRVAQLVDTIAAQLYFASGAFDEKQNRNESHPTHEQVTVFWRESAPLFTSLATEIHPHTAHQVVETLEYLLPCDPRQVFLLASESILNSSHAGFQYESLAVTAVVRLIQRVLADHRKIFQIREDDRSECLEALLRVLDLFVEAGWTEARQLTHRLEEIYR